MPALALGGANTVESLKKVPIREHLALLVSLEPPTLYDYIDVPGTFGKLVPRRQIGTQE